MAIDFGALRQVTAPQEFVGRLASLTIRTVERDGNSRQLMTITVWDEHGGTSVDNIPTATRSQKRLAWVKRMERVLAGGSEEALANTRYWKWESGGGGEFTFTVLVPGEEVELPFCDDEDLAFLEILRGIAGEASPEAPFIFASAFGNELAAQFPKLHSEFRGSSAAWVRSLYVKGALIAHPGEAPDEVCITGILL